MENVLRSYLVELGFDVRSNEFSQFEGALKQAAGFVEHYSTKIIGDLVKWQAAITGGFASIAAGFVGLADHIAEQDQSFRIWGLQMNMRAEDAKKLRMAIDSLGQPLEVILWDKELRQRFQQLLTDQDRYQKTLNNAGFENQMIAMRGFRQEVDRLHLALDYLLQLFVGKLFVALGPEIDTVEAKLKGLTDYIGDHMPEIADDFSRYVIPYLQDTWELLLETGKAAADFGAMFTNVVGFLSGDRSIEGTTLKFENFAKGIQHVINWLEDFVRGMLNAEEAFVHFVNGVTFLAQGKFKEANAEGNLMDKYLRQDFRKPVPSEGGPSATNSPGPGGLPPTVPVPATVPDVTSFGSPFPVAMVPQATAPGSDAKSHAYALAVQAGAETGIDPKLIFEQWAHESDNFRSRVFREDNNMGGIRLPGQTAYQQFASLEDYEKRYVEVLKLRRYTKQGDLQAKSEDEFVGALKRGGYMEDSAGNYIPGMRRFAGEYAQLAGRGSGPQSVDNSVTMSGDIHVHLANPTNADAKELAQQMRPVVRDELKKQHQMAVAQVSG